MLRNEVSPPDGWPEGGQNHIFTANDLANAKDTDLPDLLTSLGYQVRRVSSYYTTKEMDSLRIKDRRTWYRYSEGKGGDAIDFMQHFEGKTFPEAVDFLLAWNGRSRDPPDLAKRPPPVQRKERPAPVVEPVPFILPLPNEDTRRVTAYLKKRGIAPAVIRGFVDAGLLYEEKQHHNCVFVGKNSVNEPVYAAQRGTYDRDGASFRAGVPGSDKEIGFCLPYDSTVDRVNVFEAPIDLIRRSLGLSMTATQIKSVRKKEKQNRAADANMEEWQQIRGLLDKIRSTGLGGISVDEPDAVGKLKAKLERLEAFQNKMKAVNAYYRKHKTLDGCPELSAEEAEKLKAGMARNWRAQPKPYESYELSNNNSAIRQVKVRIEELTRQAEMPYVGWEFDGGEVKADRDANRLQVFFDEKPSREVCSAMRHAGFRWAPSVGAWQRQLNDNAIRAADHLDCIRPLFGERPSDLQKAAHRDQNRYDAVYATEDWANWDQMSIEERLAVDFCKLVRQRFPDSAADGPAEAEQTAELVQLLLNDGKRTADQMVLTVAGFMIGTEVPQEVKNMGENLMTRLASYRNSVKEKSEHNRSQER